MFVYTYVWYSRLNRFYRLFELSTYTDTDTHTHVHTHTHARAHTHARTCTHTHTHTCEATYLGGGDDMVGDMGGKFMLR